MEHIHKIINEILGKYKMGMKKVKENPQKNFINKTQRNNLHKPVIVLLAIYFNCKNEWRDWRLGVDS